MSALGIGLVYLLIAALVWQFLADRGSEGEEVFLFAAFWPLTAVLFLIVWTVLSPWLLLGWVTAWRDRRHRRRPAPSSPIANPHSRGIG